MNGSVGPGRGHWQRWAGALAGRGRRVLILSANALWRGVVGVAQSDDLTHAASMAYYALLSLFPFLLLVISAIGSITTDEHARTSALNFVLRYSPTRLEFVNQQLNMFEQQRLRIGLAGTAALIWASLGFFSAVSTAVNHAWGVERQRSYVKHKAVSFLMMTAAAAIVLVTVVLISASQVLAASPFEQLVARFSWLLAFRGLWVQYGATMLLIVGLGLVFYFVPNANVRFRDVWSGAIVTGLLWRGAFEGFAWYVRDMRRFSVHGSIGAVVVFLLWIYISSVILLYGVEFTAAYSRMRRRRPEQVPAAPSPRI